MKLISHLVLIVLCATLFSRHVESINREISPSLRHLMLRTFSLLISGSLEIKLEKNGRKKILQEKEEEEKEAKARKIINDHLTPLTKG